MKNVRMLIACLMLLPFSAFAQTPLVGTWTMEVPDEEGNMVSISLDIKDDGSYTVDFSMDGTVEVIGNYETEGGQITVWDTGGPNSCGADKKGIYKFTTSSEQLVMEKISDDCEGRGGPEGKMVFSKA